MKKSFSFPVNNFIEFKTNMLNWANQFNMFCLLDNVQFKNASSDFECLLGVGCIDSIEMNAGKAFNGFQDFSDQHKDWIFGHFGYDLKNEIEVLSSNNFDGIGFSDLCFFVPQIVIQLFKNSVTIYCEKDGSVILNTILSQKNNSADPDDFPLQIKNRISKAEYIETVQTIKNDILRGDCYLINFCQEFYSNNAVINPLNVYLQLTALSPNPFSALYKWDDKYCVCASPERYLKKEGSTIISQPIKGTAKRIPENPVLDEQNKEYLKNSEKEKSENVMVVDLVRNDISKFCKEGSVQVDELFSVYSFPQVYQMISTIRGELQPNFKISEIFKASFPMGSMTGAPKKSVMQLIEKYEKTRRGLFSGAIGYFTPDKNFDFNVVIRSVLYNETAKYLSFQTGSAITFYCDPEFEYDECLLKAAAINEVLCNSKKRIN